MTQSSWRTISQKNKKSYTCKLCRESGSQNASNNNSCIGTDDLEVKSILQKVLAKLDSVESEMKTMNGKHEQVLSELAAQKKVIANLQSDVAALNDKLEAKDKELKMRIRDHEQYNRNRNIIISGVETHQNEDLLDVIDTMAGYLHIPDHHREDVDIIHRLPASKNDKQHPRIVVQFKTRTKRDAWLVNKRHGMVSYNVVGSNNGREDKTPIYINEHLTKEWYDLLMLTKVEGKKLGYNIVNFRKNKIRVKKDVSDTKYIYITSEDDLAKLRI